MARQITSHYTLPQQIIREGGIRFTFPNLLSHLGLGLGLSINTSIPPPSPQSNKSYIYSLFVFAPFEKMHTIQLPTPMLFFFALPAALLPFCPILCIPRTKKNMKCSKAENPNAWDGLMDPKICGSG